MSDNQLLYNLKPDNTYLVFCTSITVKLKTHRKSDGDIREKWRRMNGLNENIKRFRKLLNYTQAEIALKVDCTTAPYCKYERGIADVPSRILIRIADVFHISLDEITDRGVFAKETIKDENYIEEGLKFIDRRKELWPIADECDDSQILSYVKLYNEYRDCFVTDTIYNAITYFSDRLCTSKLLKVFHASATGYRKYSANGNLVKKRNSIIAKDIERIIDKLAFLIKYISIMRLAPIHIGNTEVFFLAVPCDYSYIAIMISN